MSLNQLAGVGAGRTPEFIEMKRVGHGYWSGSARLVGRAAASATSAHADASSAGRIGWFTTDSPTPVPPRGGEGSAVGELNRQAVTKVNHIQ
jgi:hypothetical protein